MFSRRVRLALAAMLPSLGMRVWWWMAVTALCAVTCDSADAGRLRRICVPAVPDAVNPPQDHLAFSVATRGEELTPGCYFSYGSGDTILISASSSG